MRQGSSVRPHRLALLIFLAVVVGCKREPTGLDLPRLDVVVAGGDQQHGTAGTELPQPLRVVVVEADTRLPVEDVTVRWRVISGDARLLGADAQVTNEAGIAEASLGLGSVEGEITVEAAVVEQKGVSVSLSAFLVGVPELTSVSSGDVAAGEVVVLDGDNFSTLPGQNLVYFSEVRGRVLTATRTRLEVEVPRCLPERAQVPVRVALGLVSSEELEISVSQGGPVEPLDPGDYVDLSDPAGLACLRLSGTPSGAGNAAYLVLPHTASTVSGARYPFALRGMAWTPPAVAAPAAAPGALATPAAAGSSTRARSAQAELDDRLRREEAALVQRGDWTPDATGGAGAPRAPAAVPVLGSTRAFWVFNGSDDPGARFDEITATARHVGDQAVIYVDDQAPAAGFTAEDLAALGARFDDVIHLRVTTSFGSPSDLDGNDRVVILLTPVVNRLTGRDSESFVGGFFYGRDLNPDLTGSNGGEVFYALVPDPEGVHGDARTRDQVLSVIPAILAHEFQHMVHFAERVLGLGGSQDAVWMLEALAQMAEELVARDYEARGDDQSVELFRAGNRRRAELYLERPDTVSLVASSGSGTLVERGAGFLFLLYLHQQQADDLLGRLTRQTRTGVAGVEAETGRAWGPLLSDWLTAVYLDLDPQDFEPAWIAGADDALTYPAFELRDFFNFVPGTTTPSPLRVLTGGDRDFPHDTIISASSSEFIVLRPPVDGTLTLAFGGQGGGPLSPGSEAVARVLRLR